MKLLGTCLIIVVALVASSGCAKKKEISALERKQAANLVSEAEFALTLRDYARAEGLLTQAAQLTPDEGGYWMSLGSTRMRLNDKGGARAAYQSAAEAFGEAAKKPESGPEPVVQQVLVHALLGEVDKARKLQEQLLARFPNDREVRAFVEGKRLDRMLEDPNFKQVAL